jgi:hypothetical protein
VDEARKHFPRAAGEVLAGVEEGEARGTWGGQCASVVAVGEYSASAIEGTVDGARHANGQALHASRERAAIRRLDDEMKVVALHRELHQPKAEALATLRERAAHETEERLPRRRAAAQRRQPALHAQGDVQRVMPREGRAA